MPATFRLIHPHRTACDSAARSTPCWFLTPASPIPPCRSRVCHRSTSPTDSRASGTFEIGSFLRLRTRLCWSRAEDGAHVSRFWATQASSTSLTDRPPGAARAEPASISAATRWASRLPPWTVLDSWVGRPWASVPVNTRTSHTFGRRSRMVAMREHSTPDLAQILGMASLNRSCVRYDDVATLWSVYSIRRPDIARAMTSCWISDVPSKIVWILASRCQRSTGYSRV